jgi:hypothetical protein
LFLAMSLRFFAVSAPTFASSALSFAVCWLSACCGTGRCRQDDCEHRARGEDERPDLHGSLSFS